MPRSPDGTYTQPLPDVNSGEIVSSLWANTTISDIAQALTESLSREGEGGMNVPFTFGDGLVSAPGISWENETSTGFYRAATGDMRVAVLGVDLFRWNSGNAQIWDGAAWNSVLYQGQAGSVPDGTAEGQTLRWDNTGMAWQKSDALIVQATDVSVTGNLGIGTTTPTTELDVAGTVQATDVSVTGKLGIGTTTPAAELDVAGISRVGINDYIWTYAFNGSAWVFAYDSDGPFGGGIPQPLQLRGSEVNVVAESERLNLQTNSTDPADYVGISTGGPNLRFSISNEGVTNVLNTLNVQQPTPQANGTNVSIAAKYTLAVEEIPPSAVGSDAIWLLNTLGYASSSAAYKENIETLEFATAVIGQINARRFTWKPEVLGHDMYDFDIGFVAEELEQVIPQAVLRQPNGSGESVSVRDRPVVAMLVKAVQELTARIEALEP